MTRTNEVGQDITDFEAPELSEAEVAEHYTQLMAAAIERTGIAEIVEAKSAVGQMHWMCRVKQENERAWVHTVGFEVLHSLRNRVEVFFGKEYVLKGDKMKYGWVLSVGAKNIQEAAQLLSEALDKASPRVEVIEAPLIGQGPPVGGGAKGGRKGAAPVR